MVAIRSATSAAKSAISRATAHRTPEATVAAMAPMVVAMEAVARPATPAEDTAIWLGTALRVRSATTAVKSATSPATAPPRPRVSECAISASSLVTSRPLALTKCFHLPAGD
ncbi:hypothetical protein VTO42DRAFT_8213 [Malbranchea cinnamomea]